MDGYNKDKRKKTGLVILTSMLTASFFMAVSVAVSVKQYTKPFDYDKAPRFEVASESLHDGVWDRAIGAKNGNVSPGLTWDGVEGAEEYVIIMLDKDADNWLHWRAETDKAGVLSGEFADRQEGYVGPYPPSGIHSYTVYVFALKGQPRFLSAELDKGGLDFDELVMQLNDGVMTDDDNIIAIGTIMGKYSA